LFKAPKFEFGASSNIWKLLSRRFATLDMYSEMSLFVFVRLYGDFVLLGFGPEAVERR